MNSITVDIGNSNADHSHIEFELLEGLITDNDTPFNLEQSCLALITLVVYPARPPLQQFHL